MTQSMKQFGHSTAKNAFAMAFCAAASSFILIITALSLSLSVFLLLALVLFGLLISLVLRRSTPLTEQS